MEVCSGGGGCEGFYLLLPLPYTQWPLVPGTPSSPASWLWWPLFSTLFGSQFSVYSEKVNFGLLEVSVHGHWPCCLWLCAETALLRGVDSRVEALITHLGSEREKEGAPTTPLEGTPPAIWELWTRSVSSFLIGSAHLPITSSWTSIC